MGKYYGGVGDKGKQYSQHFFVIIQFLLNSNFKKQIESDLSTRKMNRDFPGDPVTQDSYAANTRGPGLILGWGTRSHMLQLRVLMMQLRPGAAK